MLRKVSSTLRVGLALFLAVFSSNLLPVLAAESAYATDNGAPQPVWCQFTNVWTAQQGSSNTNPNRVALKQLPPNSPPEMYIDSTTGQVWTPNSSFDAMKDALDAECVEQQATVTATAPTVTPVCGANNDTVTYATTAHVTYSQTGWVGGSNTVTATADQGYTLTGTSSWLLTDSPMVGCPAQPDPDVDVSSETRMTCAAGVESRTITVTTPYIFNDYTLDWELGTPGAPVYGDWTFVRNLTSAEKLSLQCAQPEQPDPQVVTTTEWQFGCTTGAESRTKTVTTPYVFDIDSWTWVLGTGSTSYSDWTYIRPLTSEEKAAYKCVTPQAPTKEDTCEPAQGTNDMIVIPDTTGVNYYIDGNLASAGEHSTGGAASVVVTVSAQDGYTLVGEYPANGWTLTFEDNASCAKVTICHRTDAVNNPYVKIEVAESAVDGVAGNNGNGEADHFGEHKGPLASSEAFAQWLKDNKIEWGDIIPPVGEHDGLNWTAQGQAMLANNCNYTFLPPTVDITTLDECVAFGETSEVTVTVTNPNDATMEYKVVIGGQTRYLTINGGDSESTSLNLPAGTHDYSVYQRAMSGDEEDEDIFALRTTSALLDNDEWMLVEEGSIILEQCPPTEVTPVAPTVTDVCGTTNDTFVLPETEGITYTTHWNGLELVVTAEAQDGYVLNIDEESSWVLDEETSTATWTHTFTNTPCILGDNDVCPNLDGSQTSVPAGYEKDALGNCVKPAGQTLGTSLPATLPATGPSDQNPVLILLAALLAYGASYFIWNRRDFASATNKLGQ